MRRLVALAATGALALGSAACGGDDGAAADTALPAVGDGPALEYRLVYSVTTPDASSTEEHEVRRPFDAHVVLRDHDGEVTADRWSALGTVVTRSAGSPAAGLTVAVATAIGDTRLDRFADELVEVGQATAGAEATVGGRACTFTSVRSLAGALPDGSQAGLEEASAIETVVDRCVDAQGIVLEERWSTPEGERLLTKRAIELEVGDDLDLDLTVPDAEPLSAAAGNGAFREVAADAAPPFAERFSLEVPTSFVPVGRFAVVPPRLQSSQAAATDAQLALYTDVWVRGADVVQLDQGAGTGGATPFDPDLTWREITLPELGPAELGGDDRSAEVRLRRADGGFVRLAGTIPVDELLELAARIRLEPAG